MLPPLSFSRPRCYPPAVRTTLGWALLYLLLAALLVNPGDWSSALSGHPGVDVYNHAWGSWWWAQSLSQGELPWRTDLIMHPRGGVLFHIDPVGALLALPIALAGGASPESVALGFNLVAVLRFALAGFAAHLLAQELAQRPGPHALVAGLAHMTAPYLLCEQYNGITEATATGFVALALWGWARALHRQRLRDHALAGLLTGLAAANSFYFGLALVLPLALILLVLLLRRRLSPLALLAGAGSTAALALPVFLLFRASFEVPDAALPRGGHQNLALILHNAVDPQELVRPGFASYDFAAAGELFEHSFYLRASLLLLALVGLLRLPRPRAAWLALSLLPLVLALGPYLVWNGALVKMGEQVVGLPFILLQLAVPELAITHAARLGVVGIASLCGLAGVALSRLSPRLGWPLSLLLGGLVAAEGLWASPISPPLPSAPAEIPALVAALEGKDPADRRGVLDLPPQVDRTMLTSRYLWYQVGHGRPIPYSIDPHIQRSGDNDVLLSLERHTRQERDSHTLSEERLRQILPTRYAWVVVHEDLEAQGRGFDVNKGGLYTRLMTELLGEPTRSDGLRHAWELAP